jgi:hypothetical protein
VGRVDDGAVRFTKDVDILLRRKDMPWVKDVLQQAGFFFGESMGAPFFLDSPNAKPSSAVDVIYANEKVKPNNAVKTPSVNDVDSGEHFRILSLETLVEMKLTSYRDKDKVH